MEVTLFVVAQVQTGFETFPDAILTMLLAIVQPTHLDIALQQFCKKHLWGKAVLRTNDLLRQA